VPGAEHYHYELSRLSALGEMVAAGPVATLVCGDMNIAPTNADVFDLHRSDARHPSGASSLGPRDVVRERWPDARA
jgi:exodeoxyribonuclease-3